MQSIITNRIQQLITHANHFYSKRLPLPALDFSLRGQKAGELCIRKITWHQREYKLRLNQVLFEQHRDYFLQQVIPHEIAHLVVDRLYLRRTKPHGEEWRSVMQDCFQCPAEPYHTLPTIKARVVARDYVYRCACQTHHFTARRHASAQKGARYMCRVCKEELIKT